jgi:hypothetical protein
MITERAEEELMAMLTFKPRTPPVELAERTGDGFAVALYWDRDRDGRLWVSVLHEDSGEVFDVDAEAGNALDVFYHPFAYSLPRAA